MDDDDVKKESLIDLKSKAMLKQAFYSQNLDEFWCSQLGIFSIGSFFDILNYNSYFL